MVKHCPQLRIQLQELKSLFSKYCLALEQVKNSKEYEGIFGTQKKLENKVKELQKLMPASLEEAREIMGKYFYGPEEVTSTFGFEISKEEIPYMPYSKEDLAKAKELGESLILRISHDVEGNPMTMQKINEMMTPRWPECRPVKEHVQDQDFYTKDSLQMEWRLVGRYFVPDVNSKKSGSSGRYTEYSSGKNYIEQTRILRDYLKSIDSLSLEEETQCSDDRLMSLAEKMGMDWKTGEIIDQIKYEANCKKVALELSQLLIIIKHNRQPVEILYDYYVEKNEEKNKEWGHFLNQDHAWSGALDSEGKFLHVSFAINPRGLYMTGWSPNKCPADVGFVSVR